jgi:hypothetical protein
MTELPNDNVKRREITQNKEVPLWLLQREDTPFLCLSFLASLLLHGLLFIILAATRIFHPFTGVSGEFELVWFSSPSAEPGQMEPVKKADVVERVAVQTGTKPADRARQLIFPVPGNSAVLPPTIRSTPPVKPPSSRVVDVAEASVNEPLPDKADAEMVISRFGGKVIEIVGKDIEIPVYKVFSAAQKSPNQRAMVQYLPEKDNHAAEKSVPVEKVKPPVPKSLDKKGGNSVAKRIEPAAPAPEIAMVAPEKSSAVAAEPLEIKAETVAVKRSEQPEKAPEAVVVAAVKRSPAAPEPLNEKAGNEPLTRMEKDSPPPAAERVANVEKIVVARVQPVQPRQSSSVVKTVPETPSGARKSKPGTREQPLVASVAVPSPRKTTEEKRTSSRVATIETSPLQRPEPPVPLAERPRERPVPATPKIVLRVDKPNRPVPKQEPPAVGPSARLEPNPAPSVVTVSSVREKTFETSPLQRPEPPAPPAERPRERPVPATQIVVLRVDKPNRPVPKQEPLAFRPSASLEPKPAPSVVTVSSVREKTVEPAPGKSVPVVPEKPHAIFLPPLAGDLKIVITGKEDIKVEAVFREFRKLRRSRPITRGEARNSRSVPLKRARTKQNVHETVIEIAEEGVYDLTIRSADGKPVTAAFVLKIRESGTGAVTKNLGKRTLPDGALLARILMPEGILWEDESYFTGTIEDSDSITRFNADKGLVWREFR